MKNIKYLIISLAMAGALMSCTKETESQKAEVAGDGPSGIELSIVTKSDVPGTTGIEDGGKMDDVLVVSVSTTGGQKKVDGMKFVDLSSPVAQTSIQLDGLNFGAHEIYLLANTKGFDSVYPGLISSVKALRIGDTFGYADAEFSTLTAGTIPQISNGVMPLTCCIKDINLGVGVTKLSAELIRPFVRLTVNVYNEAEQSLTVSGVSFNDFSPSTAYVFNHFVDSGTEYTPAGLAYQAMPTISTTFTVASRATVAVFDGLIYEGRLSNHMHDTYRVSLGFQMGTKTATAENLVFKQINENREASPMLRMLRNSHVIITAFVGYYDNKVDDFTYDVAPWKPSNISVIFQ